MMVTADEPDAELNRIAEKITTLVDARKGERQPYLVGTLGIDLGDDLKLMKQLTNKGLNDFILTRLADRMTLVRLGTHRNVTAVITGVADPDQVELPTATDVEQKRRYHYRFWAAFSVPPKGQIRILNPHDFTFEDSAEDDVPADALTIPNDLIAPTDIEARDERIKANIGTWLADNGLSEERFQAPQRLAKPRVSTAPGGGSLLGSVLAALDRRQLQSTSLSLDVVATLLSTPLD